MPTLQNLSFDVYRDDLNHPTVSGNKLHKLVAHIDVAKSQSIASITSFGGPFSNHLHALAWACRSHGLSCTGYIRGELHSTLTPTLQDCKNWGMSLRPLNRQLYRESLSLLEQSDFEPLFGSLLKPTLSDIDENTLLVPEGGSSQSAVEAVAAAYRSLFHRPQYQATTHAICATGTGATLAGLALAAPESVRVVGIQCVAEGDATLQRVRRWIGGVADRVQIIDGHIGGFAKLTPSLLKFIEEFENEYRIPIDPIYNGKVFYKLAQLASDNVFAAHDHVLVIHTGGLQGKRGLDWQTPNHNSV